MSFEMDPEMKAALAPITAVAGLEPDELDVHPGVPHAFETFAPDTAVSLRSL